MEIVKNYLIQNRFEYYENFDISQVSSIRLGEKISIVIFPKIKKELISLLKFFHMKKIYFRLFGNLSNVLFVSRVCYPVIITSKMKDEVEIVGNEVDVSAGVLMSKFSDVLRKNELSGFEGLANIPATIGGAIKNGAGAFGYNIFDKLQSILVFSNGEIKTFLKSEIKFGHHYSNLSGVFILSAKFLFEKKNEYDIIKLLNKFSYHRSKTQPTGFSLGSVYQKTNNQSAGFFIERSALKGKRMGGIIVSNKHANFFVNDGSGTIVDFLNLASFVENKVCEHFGLNLLPEIEKVGDKNEINSRLSYSFK